MQAGDYGCIVLQLLAAGICVEVNIDGGETPAGLPWHGGKTAHAARQPEADAASIHWAAPGVSARHPAKRMPRWLATTRGADHLACVLSEGAASSGQSRRRPVLLAAHFVMARPRLQKFLRPVTKTSRSQTSGPISGSECLPDGSIVVRSRGQSTYAELTFLLLWSLTYFGAGMGRASSRSRMPRVLSLAHRVEVAVKFSQRRSL